MTGSIFLGQPRIFLLGRPAIVCHLFSIFLLTPACLSFQDERDKRRAEREKDDEEALVGGLGKKKGPTGGEPRLVPWDCAWLYFCLFRVDVEYRWNFTNLQ